MAGGQPIEVHTDIHVPMRDGVTLAIDVYSGTEDKPRPALVAMSPYGKDLQSQSLKLPPQRRPSPLWDGCLEAGDIARIVSEDYVHVIADLRGSGASGGEMVGNYNAGGVPLGQDAYDLIEWVAAQPWCDGNVGMVGVSYFASMQVYAAAERPPHLKAIFVSGGHYDFYETTYHGGIMWFMPRAAREGRGGDSGIAIANVTSRMHAEYSPEELAARVEARLADPDVQRWPTLEHVMRYPKNRELWFDIVMNELDGDWYEERNPINLARNIDIPVYVQINWGRGWTVDGSIELFKTLSGTKKIDLLPYPPMQERPFHEVHDDMFRWYDYWLKGIDTGVMDEPPVSIFVEGTREELKVDDWPLDRHRVHALLPAPAPPAHPHAGAAGHRVGLARRLLPGAADHHRQGRGADLVDGAVRRDDGDDRHRCGAPVRRDRHRRHQPHPAAVGRGARRQPTARHVRAS